MQFCDKFALTTVQIALGFASCNFSFAMQFFPKLHSRPCDYLYKRAVEAAAPSALHSLAQSLIKTVDLVKIIFYFWWGTMKSKIKGSWTYVGRNVAGSCYQKLRSYYQITARP